MSSYFITNAPTSVDGTVDNDTFFIETAQSSTFRGSLGNDTFTASLGFAGVGEIRNSTIQGGPGADKMFLTAPFLKVDQFFFAGGDDNDLVAATIFNGISGSTVNGGGGLDTVRVTAFQANSTVINGNQNRDVVEADLFFGSAVRVAGGADIDTISVSAAFIEKLTVAGGGGDDVISARVLPGDGLRVFGDDDTGSEVGFDRILVEGAIGSGANINGQGGADTVTVSGTVGNFFTIGGAEGQDVLNVRLDADFAANVSGASNRGSINGGAASDVIAYENIAVSNGRNSATFVTINGGDGDDRITVTGLYDGTLNAGAGADNIGVGTFSTGTRITYDAATVSTLATTDYVSSETLGAICYDIAQNLVEAKTANVLAGPAGVNIFSSVATFIPPAGVGVTARMSILDQVTTQGTIVSFEDGLGNNFIFIQAGSQGSGITNDVLIETEEFMQGFDVANGGTLITVRQF